MSTDINWHEVFLLDEEAGELSWKELKGRREEKVGSVGTNGYLQVGYKGRLYLVHRIIFKMVRGYWPSQIDHIDRNKLNNRPSNLRPVDHRGNATNCSLGKNNTSGIAGVHWDKWKGKWVARISTQSGQRQHLLTTDDFFEAVCARKSAEVKYEYLNMG